MGKKIAIAFYKVDNSLEYDRNEFDDIYDQPEEIIRRLRLLPDEERRYYDLSKATGNDMVMDAADLMNDYNDEVIDDCGWWSVLIQVEQEPEPWVFDEQAFIDQYCPKEGGNDYLGWIDDICKLLDGEAESGDAASTGEYANWSEDELRNELKKLKRIVLKQAVDRYIKENY